jgi:hypothetical protein
VIFIQKNYTNFLPMKSFFLGILTCVFLTSCNKQNKVEEVDRAFYYWKSNEYGDDNYQFNKLKEMNVKKLYVKLFEVDYSESMGNYPYEKSNVSNVETILNDSIEIIPTIYIKNGVFQYNDQKSLEKLAENISFLANKRVKESRNYTEEKSKLNFNEIQIDCDWTKSTKDKYFYLLKKIKEKSKKKISCTLRLYAFKYPQIMGIPPVDKTMLMCYNLIKPLSQKDQNSILDTNELKKYLDKPSAYPVHMDIALPTFYWSQLYQNNKFETLLDMTEEDFKSYSKPIKPFWYEVTKDTTINWDTYIRKGDLIKYEDVKTKDLNEAIALIKKNIILDKKITISLFDLDKSTFNKYNNEEIISFYTAITK